MNIQSFDLFSFASSWLAELSTPGILLIQEDENYENHTFHTFHMESMNTMKSMVGPILQFFALSNSLPSLILA